MKKEVIYGSSLLITTIIGAGVLGIPYVVQKAGFLTGLLVIITLGLISMTINLYLGEICLRTKGTHYLPGLAEKYLGKNGKRIAMFSTFFGIYGALLAYLIGGGSALAAIFGGNTLYYSLGFFLVASTLVYFGLKSVENSELILCIFLILVVSIISYIAFDKVDINNLTEFNSKNLLIPFGVILFAFFGTSAIPEVKRAMEIDKKQMQKAIIIGSIIPIFVYILFTLVTIGVLGAGTTEIATIGLGEKLGAAMIILCNVFAVLAMFTGFLSLGLALKDSYTFDYKLHNNTAFLLTILVPLTLFLLGIHSFVRVIDLTGVITGGITFILIIVMIHIAKKHSELKPEYSTPINYFTSFILIVLLLIAIVYNLVSLLG